MKIRYALINCNTAPSYLGYWPAVARAWRKLGITPVLFFIRDSEGVSPPPADGIVHAMEPLPDVEIAVQYTWARFWGAQWYPDDVVLTSDMDVIPLSRDYFVRQFEDIPDDRWVHLGPVGGITQDKRAALAGAAGRWRLATNDIWRFRAFCHVARGRLFKEVLALPADWAQAAREVTPYYSDPFPNDNRGRTPSAIWGGDEWYPTRQIQAYKNPSVFMIFAHQNTHPPEVAGGGGGEKLIRARGSFFGEVFWISDLLKRGYYLTMHLRRPCTPESLALVDFLLQDEPPPGKVQKLLAVDAAFMKHRRRFAARIICGGIYGARLFHLACIAANHSPLDVACARLLKRTAVQKIRATLHLGRFKTLRRLRDFLRARKSSVNQDKRKT